VITNGRSKNVALCYQATTITIETSFNPVQLTALYSPPRSNMKQDSYVKLLQKFEHRSIIGGDFNAKHTAWGSRLVTTKGRELYKAVQKLGRNVLSTGKPTYWPTDKLKIPDLIDFFIISKISPSLVAVEDYVDLDSDHTPVFLKLYEKPIMVENTLSLVNKFTDWKYFQHMLENTETSVLPISNADDLDNEVLCFTQRIQHAAWCSTPKFGNKTPKIKYPRYIKDLIIKRRKLRRKWHQSRSPADKSNFNRGNDVLRREIRKYKNECFNTHLQSLSADKISDYSLWKAAKNVNRPIRHAPPIKMNDNSWAKTDQQKVDAFAEHLKNTFTPNEGDQTLPINEVWLERRVRIPKVTSHEVVAEIKRMKMKKSPGFDWITAEILHNLPKICIDKLVHIINCCFSHMVPAYWKVAEVIMIPKPGKPPHMISSYIPSDAALKTF